VWLQLFLSLGYGLHTRQFKAVPKGILRGGSQEEMRPTTGIRRLPYALKGRQKQDDETRRSGGFCRTFVLGKYRDHQPCNQGIEDRSENDSAGKTEKEKSKGASNPGFVALNNH